MNLIDSIMLYENGELSDKQTLKLFSTLIKTGKARSLQGHYGRTAQALMDDNWIDIKGNINKEKVKNNNLK